MSKKAFIPVLVLSMAIFITCNNRVSENKCQDRYNFGYDVIGVRYIIDTITIKSPIIAVYHNDLFLLPRDYIDSFVVEPHSVEAKKVFRILPKNVREDLFYAQPSNSSVFTDKVETHLSMAEHGQGLCSRAYYGNMVVLDGVVGDIEFYRFKTQPTRFALELFWYDPRRYSDDPYGPDIHIDYVDNHESVSFISKLDSLESTPMIPKNNEEPHYVLTAEPLFSSDTINKYIKDYFKNEESGNYSQDLWQYPKSFINKYCFSDM